VSVLFDTAGVQQQEAAEGMMQQPNIIPEQPAQAGGITQTHLCVNIHV
jgi:hypothetical protein